MSLVLALSPWRDHLASAGGKKERPRVLSFLYTILPSWPEPVSSVFLYHLLHLLALLCGQQSGNLCPRFTKHHHRLIVGHHQVLTGEYVKVVHLRVIIPFRVIKL